MTLEKLTEANAAALCIIAELFADLCVDGEDARVQMLFAMAAKLGPAAPLPRTDCPRCALPIALMEWHPSDNRNLCSRCSSPLRP